MNDEQNTNNLKLAESEAETEAKLDELAKVPKKETFTVGNNKFIYCFDEMSANRILQAEGLWRLQRALLKNLPKLPSELQILIERRTQQNAFAAMLMKVTPNGYEKFNHTSTSSLDALDEITGIDYDRLIECKSDFFLNTGLSLEVSTEQSEQQMTAAVAALKEMSPEQLASISPLIQNAIRQQLEMKNEKSTLTTESINTSLGSLIPGL